MPPAQVQLEKAVTELSHELEKPLVKYAWCTTLWQHSATAYGKNKNRETVELPESEWGKSDIYTNRTRGASLCRFADEYLIADFIAGIQPTFLSDKWLDISTDLFVSRLCVEKGMVILVWVLFLDYPAYCKKSLLFRINFLAHIMASPENRVMGMPIMLSSSKPGFSPAMPLFSQCKIMPSPRGFQFKRKGFSVGDLESHQIVDHRRVDWQFLKFKKKAPKKFLLYYHWAIIDNL